MNRSSRGFGLAGVLFAVIIMVVTAFFGTRAESAPDYQNNAEHKSEVTVVSDGARD
ncbi:hypothetical protein GCM10011357_32330 [Lacimicrobium alkaliphilum]|uniref:Uncharacterized protein n=1 Tax=Lacimicrobium alkaliphilum TaxID=1526571 RepID=A0ABQ1RMJ3_9ALTE|nr:hypothetical protein GCM10011357_32330 [Lacimicrobium alkaliphilum]